jgi:hypothetical protein
MKPDPQLKQEFEIIQKLLSENRFELLQFISFQISESELTDIVRRRRLTIIQNPYHAIKYLEEHENKIVLNADDEMGTNIQKILNHYS